MPMILQKQIRKREPGRTTFATGRVDPNSIVLNPKPCMHKRMMHERHERRERY